MEVIESLREYAEAISRGFNGTPTPPGWLTRETHKGKHGTPQLMLSDLHWGERVIPERIGGINEYSIAIANRRIDRVFETTAELMLDWTTAPDYSGIVLVLGGDMVSGYIHPELQTDGELPVVECMFDLAAALKRGIQFFRKEFGRVFIPCVTGNHGRFGEKQYKNSVYDDFDYVLYRMLESWFADDMGVQFHIPRGKEAQYSVHNTVYNLSHGEEFYKSFGGGMGGPYGKWEMADFKKKRRQAAVGNPYHYMIFGHYHTCRRGANWLCNGSLVGYDEYARGNNLDYELPQQALWLTHPKYGITRHEPVFADEAKQDKPQGEWVSVFKDYE